MTQNPRFCSHWMMVGSRSEPRRRAHSRHSPPRRRALEVGMDAHECRRRLGVIDTLGVEQRAKLKLQPAAGGDARAVSSIIEVRLERQLRCPLCDGSHVVHHGHDDGLQRYKCRACGQTFNSLTGTPLARLRQREKWLTQARALEEGLCLRRAAAQMGVHRTTAFRWRHRRTGRRKSPPIRASCRQHRTWRATARPVAYPERQHLSQPLEDLDGAVPRHRHVIPGRLSRLVPRPRSECENWRSTRIAARAGYRGMTASAANENRAISKVPRRY